MTGQAIQIGYDRKRFVFIVQDDERLPNLHGEHSVRTGGMKSFSSKALGFYYRGAADFGSGKSSDESLLAFSSVSHLKAWGV